MRHLLEANRFSELTAIDRLRGCECAERIFHAIHLRRVNRQRQHIERLVGHAVTACPAGSNSVAQHTTEQDLHRRTKRHIGSTVDLPFALFMHAIQNVRQELACVLHRAQLLPSAYHMLQDFQSIHSFSRLIRLLAVKRPGNLQERCVKWVPIRIWAAIGQQHHECCKRQETLDDAIGVAAVRLRGILDAPPGVNCTPNYLHASTQ
mmetsp:Transcript_56944/g.152055  ORF Transcript_56944/g.152055 Transcript_56944/m.152055 type:complete len:206 (-) Transcript_56944:394-1011(-)